MGGSILKIELFGNIQGVSVFFSLKFQVKVLFVRNLANTVTEEILEKAFSQFGKLERVKKLKDYAFIHFDERDGAVKVNNWGNYYRHLK